MHIMTPNKQHTHTTGLINGLGVITDTKVIIYKGKDSDVIYLDNIRRINLIKKRKFYTNIFFLCLAFGISAVLFYNIELDFMLKVGIILAIVLIGMLSAFHKFYFYSIIIDSKDNQSFVLSTTQFQKEQTKKFYYSIRKKLRKNKMEQQLY